TEDVSLIAAGAIAGGGLVSGDALTAEGLSIGAIGARLNTDVTSLNAQSTGGGIFFSEVGDLSISAEATGVVDVETTNGALTVAGSVSGNGVTLNAGGNGSDINVNAAVTAGPGDVVLTAGAPANRGAIVGSGLISGDELSAEGLLI